MQHTEAKPVEKMSLIVRIRASTAQIIFLVAPAGYGKSTLAASIRADYDRAALCDCSTIASCADLTRAVLEVLVVENPEKSAFYAELQMRARLTNDEQELTGILNAA